MTTSVKNTSLLAVSLLLWLTASTMPLQAKPRTDEEKQIDSAIGHALEFLAQSQQPSGAWVTDVYGESTSATSLAVMAYLAAGHVPGEGPYADSMDRAIKWVIDHQQPNGMIVHRTSHGPFYCHGISTLMLAEVVGMLQDPLSSKCRTTLEKAVAVILDAQRAPKAEEHAGGWRYQVNSRDSDLSVTAWQLLALRAAKNAGCDVPAEAIDRAVAYVKHCSSADDGGFCYQPGGRSSSTRTGTGILALEVCGKHRSDEALRGADYLLRRPLEQEEQYFYYGAYYCSIAMFKIGGKHWELARTQIVRQLLELHANDGSWLAPHGAENSAGKIYCTSMAVLALAVEYQYLPIYQR